MTDEQLLKLKQSEAFRRSAGRIERANAGSFATKIAEAYYYADMSNTRRLEEAFGDLFQRFMSPEELALFRSTEEA